MIPKRILIADDQKHSRDLLRDALIEKGFNVVGEASNGVEVIEMNARLKPDVIIMDVKMPEMNGIDAAGVITRNTPVPIILLTVKDDPVTIERAKAAGVMCYLLKPINKKELLPNIELVLSRFNEQQALKNQIDDLKETLEGRKILEKAKGILMEMNHIGEKEAFGKIRKMSMDKNIPMKEIAQGIIMTFEL